MEENKANCGSLQQSIREQHKISSRVAFYGIKRNSRRAKTEIVLRREKKICWKPKCNERKLHDNRGYPELHAAVLESFYSSLDDLSSRPDSHSNVSITIDDNSGFYPPMALLKDSFFRL